MKNNQIFLILPLLVLLMFICIFAAQKSLKSNDVTETVADGVEESVELQTITSDQSSISQVSETSTQKESETSEAEKTETNQVKTTKNIETTSKADEIETTKFVPSPELDAQGEHTAPLINNNRGDGKFYITGYTEEEGFAYGNATASGVGCRPGICAMNNQQRKELGIKYGDSIYIEGLGTYLVQDCGCRYGVVDIWCYTNAEAYKMTGYYDVYI